MLLFVQNKAFYQFPTSLPHIYHPIYRPKSPDHQTAIIQPSGTGIQTAANRKQNSRIKEPGDKQLNTNQPQNTHLTTHQAPPKKHPNRPTLQTAGCPSLQKIPPKNEYPLIPQSRNRKFSYFFNHCKPHITIYHEKGTNITIISHFSTFFAQPITQVYIFAAQKSQINHTTITIKKTKRQ